MTLGNAKIRYTSSRVLSHLYEARRGLGKLSAKLRKRAGLLKSMMRGANQYVFVTYYVGEYPSGDRGRRKAPIPVAVIANQLQNGYVRGFNNAPAKIFTGGKGRPAIKKWPFEKQVLEESGNVLRRMAASAQRRYLKGRVKNLYDEMQIVAKKYQNLLRKKIMETVAPPLEDSTIRARRSRGRYSTKPLLDTGRLVKSVRVKAYRQSTFTRLTSTGNAVHVTKPIRLATSNTSSRKRYFGDDIDEQLDYSKELYTTSEDLLNDLLKDVDVNAEDI